MGGLISIPVCLAGKLLRIPIELYELNVEPGKAVNFLSKFVSKINICFDETEKYFPFKKCNLVSYPIRFSESEKKLSKLEAIKKINLSEDKKTILILGGSQGSVFINNLFKDFILQNNNINNKIQVIHQTGSDKFDWELLYKENLICAITFDFSDNIEQYYLAADIVVCRSGAGSLSEILFFQKKCITIPLEINSNNHQLLNAKSLEKKHPDLFCVLRQSDVTKNPNLFSEKIKKTAF